MTCTKFQNEIFGVTILQGVEFSISCWFLNGPYNSAALLRYCAVCDVIILSSSFFTVGWHKATSRSESMRGSKNTSWELWYIWSSTTCQLSTSHDVDRKDGNINDYAPRGFDSRNRTRPPAGCSSCAEHDVCGLVSICAGIRAISRRQRLVSVNHGVHRRKVHRHLPSDACADNVYGQPSQAHHRCVVVLRRHLLRTLARHYNHQV